MVRARPLESHLPRVPPAKGAARSTSSRDSSASRTCSACRGAGQIITDPCRECSGAGYVQKERSVEVNVPAGVEDETRIRYQEQGEPGMSGGPRGDLYVVLHVAEHPFFERQGRDLYCVVPVSFPQAALGTEIPVPTLDGEHKLKVPEGTQSGTVFKLRNKGMPVVNSSARGDLFVDVRIETPKKLNKRQRELMQELAESIGVENKPQSRTLFSKVKDIFG
jgi:molecular chaperone DnaJ